MRPLFLLFSVAGMLAAQEPPPGTFRVGNGVSQPQIIEKQEPKYTEEARIAKMEGSVIVSLVVGEDGVPSNVRATRPIGLGLDESAVQTVSDWRFRPGTKEGKNVPVFANVSVSFRLLLDANAWRLSRAIFAPLNGASRPVMLKAKYPTSSGPIENATVSLSMDIDEKGVPSNVQARQSSDPKWEAQVIDFARAWRFQPAMKDGHAVTVHATLDFKRGNT
jgi:TonB family protein